MTETQYSQPITPPPSSNMRHDTYKQFILVENKKKNKNKPSFIRVENEKQIECKYTSIVMIKTQKKQLIGAHWALQEAS